MMRVWARTSTEEDREACAVPPRARASAIGLPVLAPAPCGVEATGTRRNNSVSEPWEGTACTVAWAPVCDTALPPCCWGWLLRGEKARIDWPVEMPGAWDAALVRRATAKSFWREKALDERVALLPRSPAPPSAGRRAARGAWKEAPMPLVAGVVGCAGSLGTRLLLHEAPLEPLLAPPASPEGPPGVQPPRVSRSSSCIACRVSSRMFSCRLHWPSWRCVVACISRTMPVRLSTCMSRARTCSLSSAFCRRSCATSCRRCAICTRSGPSRARACRSWPCCCGEAAAWDTDPDTAGTAETLPPAHAESPERRRARGGALSSAV
mmetsp:Transcript_2848/g.8802  ORF Transcript_2848/g.8802 Transcript_2848/m.8802 type:complete len:323 (-) Transcript_2848:1157-2125(-)